MELAGTDHRKKALGAFYTPRAVASRLVEWAVRTPDDLVIDPSFGGSMFLELAGERLAALASGRLPQPVVGVDVDPGAIQSGYDSGRLRRARLIEGDFFTLEPADLPAFTCNIGNPPYVRYQSWDHANSRAHAVAKQMGVPLTRLASLWAPFILHGCRFLQRGGRLAQVLPAELLHSQYAKPVTEYLATAFSRITVVVFDERLIPDALEEVILLFADGFGEGPSRGIRILSYQNLAQLQLSDLESDAPGNFQRGQALLSVLPPEAQHAYEFAAAHAQTLGSMASVNIGAVTGANEFFLRTRAEVAERQLAPELFTSVIGKASSISGAVLDDKDLDRLAAAGRPTELLLTRNASSDHLRTIAPLIAEGEAKGYHTRYKCRIRSPWWAVPLPSGGVPHAFLTYMSNAYPRLALNRCMAVSTNTVHNLFLNDAAVAPLLAAGFYNSLTLLSAEIVGRSYGGGILKLEPTEAERLLIPPLPAVLAEVLPCVDSAIRAGDLGKALELVDSVVLAPLGLTANDITVLRDARELLALRRRARGEKRHISGN